MTAGSPSSRLLFGVARHLRTAAGASSAASCTPPSCYHRADAAPRLNVAALALPNVRHDKPKALARVEQYTRVAAAQGAQIVITPETCLDGYSLHDGSFSAAEALEFAEDAETGPSILRLRALAAELCIHLCIGFAEKQDGKLYNTALLIGPDGQTCGKYRKTHGVEPGYELGEALPTFELQGALAGIRVGILICYDRQPPEPARSLAVQGAEILLIMSNGMWGGINDALLRT